MEISGCVHYSSGVIDRLASLAKHSRLTQLVTQRVGKYSESDGETSPNDAVSAVSRLQEQKKAASFQTITIGAARCVVGASSIS